MTNVLRATLFGAALMAFAAIHWSTLIHDDTYGTETDSGEAAHDEQAKKTKSAQDSNNNRPIYNESWMIHQNESIWVYSAARPDGFGMVVRDMLFAHSFAYHNGFHYGGACTLKDAHRLSPKAVKRKEQDTMLFHQLGLYPLLRYNCPPGQFVDRKSKLEKLIPAPLYISPNATTDSWSDEWIQHIRQHLIYETTSDAVRPKREGERTNNPPFKVVVHIRRRDVTPCGLQYKHRYLPNRYYLDVLDHYVPAVNNNASRITDVHIYSESDAQVTGTMPPHVETLQDFVARNYTVHLDTEISTVWRAILTADLIVASRSTFSLIPAIFRRNPSASTVIYSQFFTPPMRDWTIVLPSIQEAANAEVERLSRLCPPKEQPG